VETFKNGLVLAALSNIVHALNKVQFHGWHACVTIPQNIWHNSVTGSKINTMVWKWSRLQQTNNKLESISYYMSVASPGFWAREHAVACMFTKSGRNHRNSYINIKTMEIYVTCGSVFFKDMIMIQIQEKKHTGYKLSRWFRRSPTRQPSIDISVHEAWVRSLVWHKFYFFCFT